LRNVPEGLRKLAGGERAQRSPPPVMVAASPASWKDAGTEGRAVFRRPAGADSGCDGFPGAPPAACPRLISVALPEPAKTHLPIHSLGLEKLMTLQFNLG